MLSEHFVVAIAAPVKSPSTFAKDIGIFQYQWQPLVSQDCTFKKSATSKNCLAVSETHIFAAQADKAIVHVYNREKNNQEAVVPFPERISSLALAANDSVLVLGTVEGRILLWEICTGRLVFTPQSHLQSVTSLVIDPTSNFLLSGSSDSNIHVWSLPNLLYFTQNTDTTSQTESKFLLHTLTSHRGGITALACGHSHTSANIAVSAASDSTAIVWDFRKGVLLRTFLLVGIANAIALDVLDRGFYTTYDNGSVQLVDFYDTQESTTRSLHNNHDYSTPIQPGSFRQWTAASPESAASDLGAGLSLLLSWDGSRILSGHQSGRVISWQVATGSCQANFATFPGPVTNLVASPNPLLSKSGLRKFKVHSIVKPHIESITERVDATLIPGNYTFKTQLLGQIDASQILATEANEDTKPRQSIFEQALTHSSFPTSLLEEGLAELADWHENQNSIRKNVSGEEASTEEDFMALDTEEDRESPPEMTLQDQNEFLRNQVASLQRVQKVSFEQLNELRRKNKSLLDPMGAQNRQSHQNLSER